MSSDIGEADPSQISRIYPLIGGIPSAGATDKSFSPDLRERIPTYPTSGKRRTWKPPGREPLNRRCVMRGRTFFGVISVGGLILFVALVLGSRDGASNAIAATQNANSVSVI